MEDYSQWREIRSGPCRFGNLGKVCHNTKGERGWKPGKLDPNRKKVREPVIIGKN